MKITVSEAVPDDIPAMREVERHAVTAAHWNEEEYRRAFCGDRPRLVLALRQDDNLLAFLVGVRSGPEWEIENVAVAADARRRGLGTRLVGEFLDRVRQEGCEAVYLEVRESNHAARHMYEKWAFTEAGRRKGYYSGPEEDAIVYRCEFVNMIVSR